MHRYMIPVLAAMLRLAAAQDGRTTVTGFIYTIGVSNGGIGSTSNCQVEGNLDRGNTPIGFLSQRGCATFQNNGISQASYIEFDSNPDLKLLVSCDVEEGDCGGFFE